MGSEGVLAVPDERVIRDELQRMVLADLLGPLGGPDEEFRGDPVDRYIVGRLAPNGVAISPDTKDELPDAGAPDILEGESEPSAPRRPQPRPSALGFTASIDGTATALLVSGAWGRYERVTSEREEHAGRRVWRRQPQGGTITVPLTEGPLPPAPVDKGQPHIVVRGKARRHDGRWLVSVPELIRSPAHLREFGSTVMAPGACWWVRAEPSHPVWRSSGRSCRREGDLDGGALSGLRGDCDRAAVRGHDRLDDGQAQT